MANKKRRKPAGRPRPQGSVKTADRPETNGKATAPERARNGQSTGPSARSQERAERKDIARRQREEVRRIMRRRERMRRAAWIGGIAVVALAAAWWFMRPDNPVVATEDLPGILLTQAPWDNNSELALERADDINLPAHGTNLAMHEHVNLQVFVHGSPQQVPVDIGITSQDAASLHTHTSDGLVHIESGTVADFDLGQFFDIWGVRYTPSCLGAYCNDAQNQLRVFVNGQPYAGTNITQVPLDPESVIVVTYGTEEELPDPVPSSFDFSSINP